MANENVVNDVTEKNLVMSNRITSYVVLGSLFMGLMLVCLLFMQLYDLNKEPKTEAIGVLKTQQFFDAEDKVQSKLALMLLEHDAQHLRTRRSQSLVGARLFVQSISVIAGISLLIMGSSIVFARIKSPGSKLTAKNQENSFSLATSSPGLILALYGTILIVGALFVSLHSKTLTTDNPVFLGRINPDTLYPGQYVGADIPADPETAWENIKSRVEGD